QLIKMKPPCQRTPQQALRSTKRCPLRRGEGKGEVGPSIKPYVHFSERDFNRKLSVEKVLEKLRRWMPKQYELAEVVGKWIWITFPEPPAERVRADLTYLSVAAPQPINK